MHGKRLLQAHQRNMSSLTFFVQNLDREYKLFGSAACLCCVVMFQLFPLLLTARLCMLQCLLELQLLVHGYFQLLF